MSNIVSAVGLWPLLGSALPLLVALATKRETKSGIQGCLFVFLAAVAGFVEAFVKAHNAGSAFNWHAALASAAGVLVVGQSMHLAVWKTTGVARKLQSIGSAVNAEAKKILSPTQYAELKADLGRYASELGEKLQANAQKVDDAAKAVAQASTVVAAQAAPATPAAEPSAEDTADAALVVPPVEDDDKLAAS